jgi:hypothetical protein
MKGEGTMADTYTDLCYGCKRFVEIAWTEGGTERPYCRACTDAIPPTQDQLNMLLLLAPWSPIGPPFVPGDVVEARTGAILFDGVGTVREMSTSLKNGATPIYPTFLVTITEKAHEGAPDEAWYTEVCLTRVAEPPTGDGAR